MARPRPLAGLVALALLGGCAIGPDYERPRVAEPATFRGQATAEATSLADAPWWEVFQDPVLKGLVQEALRNNYDVQIAAARVQEARANLGIARSDFFPSLDYSVDVARGNVAPGPLGAPGGKAPTTRTFYSGTMAASWELDIWGRIRRANEAARAALLATEDARRGVWLTLVSDLAQAYFELLALDVQLRIARNSTEAYQRTYDLFLDRFQLGVASKLETSRAEGALGEAQANIPQLESEVIAKENQICILLGRVPGPIPRGMRMYEQPAVPVVPAGLPSTLLGRRPDLRQAEQELVAANARIGIAKAEFFPKLRRGEPPAVGHHRRQRDDLGGRRWAQRAPLQRRPHPRDLSGVHRAVGAGKAPVRAGGTDRAAGSLGRADCARQAERGGDDRSVRALEEAVQHATDRYGQGLASYYEVLEAQQQLYPAQTALAQIRRGRLVTHVRLYKALGGGWSLTDAQWSGVRP